MNFCVVEGQIRSKGSITRMCYAALGLYVLDDAMKFAAKITPPIAIMAWRLRWAVCAAA